MRANLRRQGYGPARYTDASTGLQDELWVHHSHRMPPADEQADEATGQATDEARAGARGERHEQRTRAAACPEERAVH